MSHHVNVSSHDIEIIAGLDQSQDCLWMFGASELMIVVDD